ncbi:hypothetical protein D3C85_1314100 [compost metagenome]
MPAARSSSRLGRVPGSWGKICGPSTSARRLSLGSSLARRKSSKAHPDSSHSSSCRNSLLTMPRLYTVGAPGRSPSQLDTSGKSTSSTSAPAASSAWRACCHRSITVARVLMRWPVGPPMPGFSEVPASASALMYMRGTPKRLPLSALASTARSRYEAGRTVEAAGIGTQGCRRHRSPRLSGSSATTTSRISSRSAMVRA